MTLKERAFKFAKEKSEVTIAVTENRYFEGLVSAYIEGNEDILQHAQRDIKELLYYVEDNAENKVFRESIKKCWGIKW